MESFDVVHANPDPRFPATLIASTQVKRSSITNDACEISVTPTGVLEAQDIDIEAEAELHVLNA
jgi:hypothetical protein